MGELLVEGSSRGWAGLPLAGSGHGRRGAQRALLGPVHDAMVRGVLVPRARRSPPRLHQPRCGNGNYVIVSPQFGEGARSSARGGRQGRTAQPLHQRPPRSAPAPSTRGPAADSPSRRGTSSPARPQPDAVASSAALPRRSIEIPIARPRWSLPVRRISNTYARYQSDGRSFNREARRREQLALAAKNIRHPSHRRHHHDRPGGRGGRIQPRHALVGTGPATMFRDGAARTVRGTARAGSTRSPSFAERRAMLLSPARPGSTSSRRTGSSRAASTHARHRTHRPCARLYSEMLSLVLFIGRSMACTPPNASEPHCSPVASVRRVASPQTASATTLAPLRPWTATVTLLRNEIGHQYVFGLDGSLLADAYGYPSAHSVTGGR